MAHPIYSFGLFAFIFLANTAVIVIKLLWEGSKGVDKFYGIQGPNSPHLWRVVCMFTLVGAFANAYASIHTGPIAIHEDVPLVVSAFNYCVVIFYVVEAFVTQSVDYRPFVGMLIALFFLQNW